MLVDSLQYFISVLCLIVDMFMACTLFKEGSRPLCSLGSHEQLAVNFKFMILKDHSSYSHNLKAKLYWLLTLSYVWWSIFPRRVLTFALAQPLYSVFFFCVSICIHMYVYVSLYIDWQKWRARIVHSSRIACPLMKACEYTATPTLRTLSLQSQPFTEIMCVFCVYTPSSRYLVLFPCLCVCAQACACTFNCMEKESHKYSAT